jgi:hypothetical protein
MLPHNVYIRELASCGILHKLNSTAVNEGIFIKNLQGGTFAFESSPFSRKKFLSLCSIVKTTEWNGMIKTDILNIISNFNTYICLT